jgi:hypothetical protein
MLLYFQPMKQSLYLAFGALLGLGILLPQSSFAAAHFYRGYELVSTTKPNAMGSQEYNAFKLTNGKKVVIGAAALAILHDHGAINGTHTPRDPQHSSVIYLGTNHYVKAEGGQEGVFTVWLYDQKNGDIRRIASQHFDPSEVTNGYQVVGNEGTQLIVARVLSPLGCIHDLPESTGTDFLSLDMRHPIQGFHKYVPSISMRSVFHATPSCLTGAAQNNELVFSADPSIAMLGQTVSLNARYSGQMPVGGYIQIADTNSATLPNPIGQKCYSSTCSVTVSMTNTSRPQPYGAFVYDSTGRNVLAFAYLAVTGISQ